MSAFAEFAGAHGLDFDVSAPGASSKALDAYSEQLASELRRAASGV